MRIDPAFLKAKVAALMSQYPELAEDEDLRLSTIEGETECFELLAMLTENILADAAMQDAIALRAKDLRERKDRFAAREQMWREIAQAVMAAADLRKAQLAQATLSIRPKPPAVQIIDEEAIPDEFFRIKKEPNLSAIKDALKENVDVPGCTLSNQADTLAVLTK